jgi:hypothetical protein
MIRPKLKQTIPNGITTPEKTPFTVPETKIGSEAYILLDRLSSPLNRAKCSFQKTNGIWHADCIQ